MSLLASIPSPSDNGFDLGPLFVHAYGLCYVVGMTAAVLVARWGWRRAGGDPALPAEVALWGVPAGLIGGRLYFALTTPSQLPDHWWGIFAIWEGGLGIWGGIAGGVAGGWVVLRRRLPPAQRALFLEVAAPGVLVAQAIGRVGNYFNQEIFGGPSTLPWALRIDPAHRPVGYETYSTFAPTFLYELIWNLLLAGALVWLGTRGRFRAPALFALYVAGYSAFRVFEETQRIDFSNRLLGMRLNFWIATALCLAGLITFAQIQRGSQNPLSQTPVSPGAGPAAAMSSSGVGAGVNPVPRQE